MIVPGVPQPVQFGAAGVVFHVKVLFLRLGQGGGPAEVGLDAGFRRSLRHGVREEIVVRNAGGAQPQGLGDGQEAGGLYGPLVKFRLRLLPPLELLCVPAVGIAPEQGACQVRVAVVKARH